MNPNPPKTRLSEEEWEREKVLPIYEQSLKEAKTFIDPVQLCAFLKGDINLETFLKSDLRVG